MAAKVVTRFPPSPTGFLHIGSARTALFNWLYAKANGGEMVLRIEDTDRERYTSEAVDAIYEGLKWLGLDWAGEPVSQHTRADRHIEVANELLAKGRAYHCYCSPEELAEMREKAKAEGRPVRYDGTWRDRPASDAPQGIAPVLRFKAETGGETIVRDQVQGNVTFANADLDDLILLRSDGSPTYNLSVVVDDHDMGITHIIRGVDHLTNAARQIGIYEALGWDVPLMAHIPLIHGDDGAKLSKRHGAMGVEAYRAMGYLPEAMRNYLARLGWSHGDDEFFSTEQAIEWFTLEGINKSAARFDFAKLENLNGQHIRAMAPDDLERAFFDALPHLPGGPDFAAALDEPASERFTRALPVLAERAKTLNDLMTGAAFIIAKRPLQPDEKAMNALDTNGKAILQQIAPVLEQVDDWSKEPLADALKTLSSELDVKFGKIGQPLRAALAGTMASPGIYDIMLILGKSETIERIGDVINA